MSKYNAKAIMLGLQSTVSKEDNDLNITINADHEGNGDEGEEGAAVDTAAEVPVAVVEEVAPAEGEVVDEVVADTSGTPEAAELDVQDAAEDVDDTQEQIENINEATEGLESLAYTLAKISVEGLAVTPLTAQMLNSHYDFVTRKFPALRTSANRVESLESFSLNAEEATNVSLEKVMDGIKNGISAIISYLKDLGQKLLALVGHVLSAAAVMRRKAEGLKTKAAGYKDSPKKVSVPSLLTTKELGVASIKELADLLDSIGTKGYEALASNNDGEIGANVHVDSVKAFFGKTFIGGFKIDNTTDGPGLTTVEGKDGEKIALSGSEAAALAGAVIGLAGAIESYKRGESVRKNLVKKLTDEATALNNSTGEETGKIQAIRKRMKAVSELMAFEKRLIAKGLAVGNAVNNVIAAAIDAKDTSPAPAGAAQLPAPTKK